MGWKKWNEVGTPMKTSRQSSLGHLLVPDLVLQGPKMDQNRILEKPFGHTNQLKGYILGWKGWKKVGTPRKTSIQTSMGHLPPPECLKCGPMGAKKGPKLAKNSLLATQIGAESLF